MSLEKSLEDFKFIDKLPGKKIILKGNHDYWWTTASAAYKFFKKNNITTISILHNNCFFYKSSAICGTRGWFCEEEHGSANDRKIMNREIMRLERSLQAAGDCKEKLCFFHYPPLYNNYVCQEVIDTMKKYDVKSCWYGHIHGYAHKLAVTGRVDGINYSMVSADYVGFEPVLIE